MESELSTTESGTETIPGPISGLGVGDSYGGARLNPLRIAFCGPAGAGKSTCTEHLKSAYGGKVLSFATALKDLATQLGWDGKKDERGRTFLQQLGQTLRGWDKAYWIRRLDFSPDLDKDPVFIDDLRFQNELKYLKRHGFHVVYLKPFGFRMDEPWRKDESENDISENEVHTIIASHKGQVDTLLDSVDALVSRLTTPIGIEE